MGLCFYIVWDLEREEFKQVMRYINIYVPAESFFKKGVKVAWNFTARVCVVVCYSIIDGRGWKNYNIGHRVLRIYLYSTDQNPKKRQIIPVEKSQYNEVS